MIEGVDISVYQGAINWAQMATTNAQFVWMRAAIGKYLDPRLGEYSIGAKNHGFPYGFYYVIRPATTSDWKEQVQAHANIEGLYSPPLTPVVDCEIDGGLSKQALGDWIFKYQARFFELTGHVLMIYTRASWWDLHVYRNDWAKIHPLWVAHYGAQTPTLPADWGAISQPKTWSLWQYSADGNGMGDAYGVQSASIDLDHFNGDGAAFLKQFGAAPRDLNVPQPPPAGLPRFVSVKVARANIRNAPTMLNSDVGDTFLGNRMEVIGEDGDWYIVKLYISKSVVNPSL